jgi:WD repeat-containing protein 68
MPENSGNAQGQYLPSTAPPAANSSFDAPRHRASTQGGRTNEELHISTSVGQHAAVPPAASAQQMYNSPDNYRSAPNINVDQGTPQNSQYGAPAVPGSLQPAGGSGQQQRPGPSNAYTTPIVPTQTQIASNAQQYTLPTRSNTISQPQHSPHSAHSYSRSSPAGLGPEQKYIPFSNTPEQSKYSAGTPAQKYYPSTSSGAASHSPLGLADIRPRANSTMDPEGGMGHGSAMISDGNKVPSNSNYLAPWSIYAYDWCKWNVPGGNSAGKMAVGSYLEDNHNFVCDMLTSRELVANEFVRSASSTRK